MNVLLDTHAAIWFLEGEAQLSQTARSVIEHPGNQHFLSIVSYWEMAIKVSIGKLETTKSLSEIYQNIADNGMQILSIKPIHTLTVSILPFHHKDPFDRMILAQAMAENMPVISKDQHFNQYPVAVIW